MQMRRWLGSGADLLAKDDQGKSALHHAMAHNRAICVEILLSMGADIHGRDLDGKTPLYSAINGGSLKHVQRLLELGADVNAINNFGETPIYEAIKKCDHEVFMCLFAAGANLSVKQGNKTALEFARYTKKGIYNGELNRSLSKIIQLLAMNEEQNHLASCIKAEDQLDSLKF